MKPVNCIKALLFSAAYLFVGLLVFLIDLARPFLGKKEIGEFGRPAAKTASIVIPTFNGKGLLAECLPSLQKAIEFDGQKHEVIVVDNGSTDGTADFVRKKFPFARLVRMGSNTFFSGAANAGAKAASNDIVIFLNDDMVVDKNFIRPLLGHFRDKTVFAVASQIFMRDRERRRIETGRTGTAFFWGSFNLFHRETIENYPVPVAYAGGGSSAYNREMFLALGGFNGELYNPVYGEEIDICFRAWKHGLKVLLEPNSRVWHRHRATFSKLFEAKKLDAVLEKHKLFFVLRNVSSKSLLLKHFLLSPLWLLGAAAFNRAALLECFPMLLGGVATPLKQRLSSRERFALSDEEAFSVSNSIASFKERFGALPRKKKKPSILFLTPYLPCENVHAGGARMFNIIKRLSKRHNTFVLSFESRESNEFHRQELEKHCRYLRTVWRGAPIIPLRLLRAHRPFWEFYSRKMLSELEKALALHDIDIVHLEYAQMLLYAPKIRGAKKILTEHEVAFFSLRRKIQLEKNPLKKMVLLGLYPMLKRAELQGIRKVDKVICLSPADANALQKEGIADILLSPMGADLKFFRPRGKSRGNTIVFVGNFRHYPNGDAVLFFAKEIFPLVKKKIPKAKFLVVGSFPPKKILALNSEGITVTGWVEDLRQYLGEATVFVAPIRLGSGVRGKVVEAFAMGKAIVGTPVAFEGIKAVNGHNAFVASSPREFAEKTVRLLQDKALRERMGRNARKTAENNYGWEKIVGKIEAIYPRALG
jgi:GT2 family glycosyltransferase/glycosyltransferase involved in cell wall biosynthesis